MCTAGDSRVFCAGNCTCCLHMYIRVLYTCTCIFIDKFHFSLTRLPIHQQHQCMEFITGTAYSSWTLDFTPVFFLVGSDFIFLCCVFCFVYELYLVQNQRYDRGWYFFYTITNLCKTIYTHMSNILQGWYDWGWYFFPMFQTGYCCACYP